MLAPALGKLRLANLLNEETQGEMAGESGEGGACAEAAEELAEAWEAGVEDDWDAEMVGAEADWDAEMVGAEDDWDAEMVGAEDDWDAEKVGAEDTFRSMMAAALAKAVSTVTWAEGVPGGEVPERIMRTRRAGRRGQGDRSSRRGTRRSPLACARESARMRA
jgi:hypothetical protein